MRLMFERDIGRYLITMRFHFLNKTHFVLAFTLILTSCTLEKRLYRPGFNVEWNRANIESSELEESVLREQIKDQPLATIENQIIIIEEVETAAKDPLSYSSNTIVKQTSLPVNLNESLTLPERISIDTSPDTLKKPYKQQQQYREVDPVGKVAVAVVLAGVALQKIAGILTWFEVIMPLSFGPGVFIPALIVAVIGLVLSAYSAWRVRKNPEKYKKSEWGKASLAILGWQILMSALFAWLLGGLPIG
jgi:hypothetical protein